jgi:hypothetical protein
MHSNTLWTRRRAFLRRYMPYAKGHAHRTISHRNLDDLHWQCHCVRALTLALELPFQDIPNGTLRDDTCGGGRDLRELRVADEET